MFRRVFTSAVGCNSIAPFGGCVAAAAAHGRFIFVSGTTVDDAMREAVRDAEESVRPISSDFEMRMRGTKDVLSESSKPEKAARNSMTPDAKDVNGTPLP
jgi:hypothetical protein